MEGTQKDTEAPRRQNGAAIRALRQKDGWSQTALAAEVGIHQGTLSEIENETSNARVTTLNLIARAMRVPVAAIMRELPESVSEPAA